jgi:hypothetical protein
MKILKILFLTLPLPFVSGCASIPNAKELLREIDGDEIQITASTPWSTLTVSAKKIRTFHYSSAESVNVENGRENNDAN